MSSKGIVCLVKSVLQPFVEKANWPGAGGASSAKNPPVAAITINVTSIKTIPAVAIRREIFLKYGGSGFIIVQSTEEVWQGSNGPSF